jgi:hypothetical protein
MTPHRVGRHRAAPHRISGHHAARHRAGRGGFARHRRAAPRSPAPPRTTCITLVGQCDETRPSPGLYSQVAVSGSMPWARASASTR